MTITHEHRGFSPTYDTLRERLKNSENAFTFELHEYDNTPAQWQQIKKLFGNLVKAVRHADTCIGEIDLQERQHLARFLTEAADPYIEYFRELIDAVDDGASLSDAFVAMDQRHDLE